MNCLQGKQNSQVANIPCNTLYYSKTRKVFLVCTDKEYTLTQFLLEHPLEVFVFYHSRWPHRVKGDGNMYESIWIDFLYCIFYHLFDHVAHRTRRCREGHHDRYSIFVFKNSNFIHQSQRPNIYDGKFWIIHRLELCFDRCYHVVKRLLFWAHTRQQYVKARKKQARRSQQLLTSCW